MADMNWLSMALPNRPQMAAGDGMGSNFLQMWLRNMGGGQIPQFSPGGSFAMGQGYQPSIGNRPSMLTGGTFAMPNGGGISQQSPVMPAINPGTATANYGGGISNMPSQTVAPPPAAPVGGISRPGFSTNNLAPNLYPFYGFDQSN